MKQLFFILVLLFPLSLGAGLQASFTGSRICDMGDQYTIFEYCSNTDGSGNLIDHVENLVTYSNDFSQWTPTNASVIVNQYKSPIDNTLTADILHEDGTAGVIHRVEMAFFPAITTDTLSLYVKPLNRTWIRINSSTSGVSFNCSGNGTIGTYIGTGIDGKIQKIIGDWYRISVQISGGSATFYISILDADNSAVFDGLDQDSFVISGAQIVDNVDGVITGPGKYIATGAVNKPRLDLAPTAAPPSIATDLQASDGNVLMARSFDGATQWYDHTDSDCADVNDSDHTYTFVLNQSSTFAATDTIFQKGPLDTSGIWIYITGGTRVDAAYSKGGSDVVATGSATLTTDKYHVVQVVRNSNLVTVYTDGTAGVSVDVSTFGIDNASTFYIGTYSAGFNMFIGSVLYSRLQSRALPTVELDRDRAEIQGILSNHSKRTNFIFSRSTSAYKTLSTGGISNTAINVPRVTDGVLIEGQRTNSYQYSEDRIGQMSQLGDGTIAFGVNDLMAPDGTMTAESVSDTNEAGPLTYVIGQTATNPVTAATVYTVSFHIKKLPTATAVSNNLDVRLVNGAHDSENWFNPVTGQWGAAIGTALIARNVESTGDGWWRISQTLTALSTANLTVAVYLNGSVVYTATGVAQIGIWGSQTEPLSFMSSYIPNLAASSTVRTADNMSYDIHPSGSTDFALPLIFQPNTNRDKLTYEFDLKCEFSSSTDMAGGPYRILTIGDPSSVNNSLDVYFSTSGRIDSYFTDSVGTGHYVLGGTDFVPYNQWHTLKGFFDFSDMSRMNFWVDGVVNNGNGIGGNIGTATFDTTNNLIKIGQARNGGNFMFCWIRNLRIEVAEF